MVKCLALHTGPHWSMSLSVDLPALCLVGTGCPPSLSQETAGECDLDLHPPLQRDTERSERVIYIVCCPFVSLNSLFRVFLLFSSASFVCWHINKLWIHVSVIFLKVWMQPASIKIRIHLSDKCIKWRQDYRTAVFMCEQCQVGLLNESISAKQ